MKQIEESIEQRANAIAIKRLQSGDEEMAEEDDNEEDIELPEPTVAKTKSVALPFAAALGSQKTPQEEEKSQVFQRRHKLFTELKQVPLNIQQSDNIWLLEDFLLKRVKTSEEVKRLVQQTRPAYRSGLFNSDRGSEEATQRFEEIDNPELQDLHRRCLGRISELLDEATDQNMFDQLKPEILDEMTQEIACTVVDTEVTEPQLKLFYQALYYLTEDMIKEHEMHSGEGEDSRLDDLGHEELRDHIQQMIIVKMQSFFGMLDTLKNRVKEQMDILKKEKTEKGKENEEMKEESKEEAKVEPDAVPTTEEQKNTVEETKEDQKNEPKQEKMEIDSTEQDGGETQAKTKIQSSSLPVIEGDGPVLS